jgi:hypothetical protein
MVIIKQDVFSELSFTVVESIWKSRNTQEEYSTPTQ